jgi:ABC-type uncharacterized transport system permease subunit
MTINLGNISWRSIEKVVAYGAATVAATDGFAQVSMPAGVREWLLGISGIVIAAIHISGPAATPNTSTSPSNPVVK